MLGRVQSMALSLLNRLDSEGCGHEEEGDYGVSVTGCEDCEGIFRTEVYATGQNGTERDGCPWGCGHALRDLGNLPRLVEDDGEVFLAGDDGFTTGPYRNAAVAQAQLWDWFNEREKHGSEKEDGQEGRRQENTGKGKGYLRLVSNQRIQLKGSAEEGNEEREGSKADQTPSSKGGSGKEERERGGR